MWSLSFCDWLHLPRESLKSSIAIWKHKGFQTVGEREVWCHFQRAIIDWLDFDSAFYDADACFKRFCEILHSLVWELVPVKLPTEQHPPWPTHPPGSLLCLRFIHWNNNKLSRHEHGWRSISAVEALSQFNVAYASIHKFYVTSQAERESSVIHHMKESPKLFHSHIHHKKIGQTSVGPLCSTTGELSDSPQAMGESSKSFFLVLHLP